MSKKRSTPRVVGPTKAPQPAPGDIPVQTATFVRRHDGEDQIDIPGYQKDGLPCPQAPLKGAEAAKYADYFSMWTDLEHVIALCDVKSNVENGLSVEDGLVAVRGLWEATVIAYGRAFTSGVSAFGGGRTRFPSEIIDQLSDEHRAIHDQTLELRNRHVGHRVNDWSQIRVTAVLDPDPTRGFLHLGQFILSVVQGVDSTNSLRAVAVELRDALNKHMTAIGVGLAAGARTVPVDRLYESAETGTPLTIV